MKDQRADRLTGSGSSPDPDASRPTPDVSGHSPTKTAPADAAAPGADRSPGSDTVANSTAEAPGLDPAVADPAVVEVHRGQDATEAPSAAESTASVNGQAPPGGGTKTAEHAPADPPPAATALPETTPSGAALPKAEQPKTEQPKTEQPKTEQPKTEQPKTEQPKTAQPKTAQPKTAQPETAQPRTALPKAEARAAEPTPTEPAPARTSQATAARPRTDPPKAEARATEATPTARAGSEPSRHDTASTAERSGQHASRGGSMWSDHAWSAAADTENVWQTTSAADEAAPDPRGAMRETARPHSRARPTNAPSRHEEPSLPEDEYSDRRTFAPIASPAALGVTSLILAVTSLLDTGLGSDLASLRALAAPGDPTVAVRTGAIVSAGLAMVALAIALAALLGATTADSGQVRLARSTAGAAVLVALVSLVSAVLVLALAAATTVPSAGFS